MTTNTTIKRGLAAVAIASLITSGLAVRAMADNSPMEVELCAKACSLTITDKAVAEGGTITVDVVGAPGANVELSLFKVGTNGWTKAGEAVPVSVGADGRADDVKLAVPMVPDGEFGGEMTITVADWKAGGEAGLLTQPDFIVLSRNVMVSNFSEPGPNGEIGFAAPAGGEILTQFMYKLPDQTFLLEIFLDGKWQTLQYKPQDQSGPVKFGIPQDTPAGTYKMRAVNTSTGATLHEDVLSLTVTTSGSKSDPGKPSKPAKPAKPGKKPSMPKTGV